MIIIHMDIANGNLQTAKNMMIPVWMELVLNVVTQSQHCLDI